MIHPRSSNSADLAEADPPIVLASASPRRLELLLQIGLSPRVWVSQVPESRLSGESPRAYTERVARAKALAATEHFADAVVIGADTVVALDAEILGKPRDRSDAARMLRALSGREHEVFSAVAVWRAGRMLSSVSRSQVHFGALSEAGIAAYCDTGEPDDKAGGYGIQGRAAVFITELRGSYSGVVGLPLFETAELLRQHRIELLNHAGSDRL